MKKIILLFITAFSVALITGCFYDKEELVYPTTGTGSNCDTANMRYSVDITNILSASCYSCHSGTAASGGGIRLDTYNGVKNMVNNGQLMRAITHSGGASPMPKGGSKLPACTIAKIKAWIDRGAPQN
ncbi:c-type cytochrome domain-containing protein [Aridibaculum aurantiacum]|uniref:c-type cytochrome domain-containing protein n=1 Tax=Aridibaculum aurantiacum TaxID=2810307 RepID=UPI001A9572C2|nr:c-type cytochrome domain-containing protein [Aridibaculum aurantiacum]